MVVTLQYMFFQSFSNAEQISVRLIRFRKKSPAVVLTSHAGFTVFFLDVRWAVQSGLVSFFAAVCP